MRHEDERVQTTNPGLSSALSRAGAAALILAALSVLAGCASEPTQPPQMTAASPLPSPAATPVEAPKPSYRGPWEDPSSPLYNRTIYFDYDSVEIKPEYIPVMRNHAAFLGSDTRRRVTLEGHTDERGTREYNLALADQRTDAVRRFMIAEGVLPDQLATLSYGEERPAASGHNEGAWQQNRRVVIQY